MDDFRGICGSGQSQAEMQAIQCICVPLSSFPMYGRKCSYCGLNAGNPDLERFRMSSEEILATAVAVGAGYRTIVLQSGEDEYYTREVLGDIIAEIKKTCSWQYRRFSLIPSVTVSVGERPDEDYRHWFRKGADRYSLKHETS